MDHGPRSSGKHGPPVIDPYKTIYFRQTWKDPRLALYYLNCSLNIDADFSSKIWLPDIYFINDKKSFMHDVTRKNRMFRTRSYFQNPKWKARDSWEGTFYGGPPSGLS